MQFREQTQPNKRPYAKPRLRTIELVAQQVLSIGCKMQGGLAQKGPSLTDPCQITGCEVLGS